VVTVSHLPEPVPPALIRLPVPPEYVMEPGLTLVEQVRGSPRRSEMLTSSKRM